MTDAYLAPIIDAIGLNTPLEDILRSMTRPGTTTPELEWDGKLWVCYWIFDHYLCIGRSTNPRHAVWFAVARAEKARRDEADHA